MTIAAIRHNNPGDVSLPIKGWTGVGKIVGVEGQPGYAEFPTMQIGFEAFQQRLRSYIVDQHRNTIRKIGTVYAADPHWPAAVASIAKLPEDGVIDPENATQMEALASAIVKQETGYSFAELCSKAE